MSDIYCLLTVICAQIANFVEYKSGISKEPTIQIIQSTNQITISISNPNYWNIYPFLISVVMMTKL